MGDEVGGLRVLDPLELVLLAAPRDLKDLANWDGLHLTGLLVSDEERPCRLIGRARARLVIVEIV